VVAAPPLTAERLLRTLEWRVVRPLDGRLQGDYRSLFTGSGLDFTDLREYEPGDDPRHIEWNVTARLDTPWVRQYVESRELTAWLLLDHSASMAFGPVDRQKSLVLAEVATTLAHVLTRGGNRVGAVVLDRDVERVIAPAQGRVQVLRIAEALLAQRRAAADRDERDSDAGGESGHTGRTGRADRSAVGPTGWLARRRQRRDRRAAARAGADTDRARSSTDLAVLLRAASGLARRRSLVIVVSDFITAPGWEPHLGRLAQRHDVVAIQVTDPRELDLPDAGAVYVEDAETGEQIFVDTSDPGFRARLRAAADRRQAEIAAATARSGVELYRVGTDDDLVRSLVRIASLRRRRRRGPR
jgi:uncharacterized protein (DUF58 family)